MTAAQQRKAGRVGAAAAGAPRESAAEWRVDAVVHVLGVALGLAGCVGLGALAPSASPPVLASIAVYGIGLLTMLGCSALYNIWGRDHPRALWRRLDHAAIFVMIAATYTPFLTLAIGGAWGTGLLIYVWLVAAAGVLLKLLHPGRIEKLSIAAYLLLGWTVVIIFDRLLAAVPTTAVTLLMAGGLIYSSGVVIYRWHGLPYHRAIWHVFVLLAAACHYFAVLDVATH